MIASLASDRLEEPGRPVYRIRLKGAFMLKAGLRTDAEIADSLGYSHSLTQGVLSGRLYPSNQVQRVMARVLSLSIGELRGLL